MPSNARRLSRTGVLAALAVTVIPGPARAQDDAWRTLVLEADSIGPVTPRFAPTRWTPCADAPAADSLRLSGPADEFMLSSRSLRTRGYFTFAELPDAGSGTFALRAILCDEESRRPLTFVLERDHRYFYLIFSLREVSSYRGVTLFSGSAPESCYRWAPDPGRFAPVACSGAGGRKC